jgi:hypothetical protein
MLVVPDRSGEREEPLEHAYEDALGAVAVMVFKAELAFQGVEHGLDDLTDRFQLPPTTSRFLSCFGRAQELDIMSGEACLELTGGVPFVTDDGLAVTAGEQSGVVFEHVEGDVSFIEFRVRQRERDR